jgi:hypothetical protein
VAIGSTDVAIRSAWLIAVYGQWSQNDWHHEVADRRSTRIVTFGSLNLTARIDRQQSTLTPAQWHAARQWYLQKIDGCEAVTTADYNSAIKRLESTSWENGRDIGAVACEIPVEHFPTPRQVGLFELTNAQLISVVVPVFNEEATIISVLRRLASVPAVAQIIVVNDASRDHTGECLADLKNSLHESFWTSRLAGGLQILTHQTNQGKGAALRSGFQQITQAWTGVQDADSEYDPNDLMRLLTEAYIQQANVIYGSRFLLNEPGSSPLWHRQGNRLITTLANLSFGLSLTDVETCYKLIETNRLQRIAPQLRENRFGIEIELTARLARSPGVYFAECPITYDRRTYAEGKKIGLRDGFRALWCMARYR